MKFIRQNASLLGILVAFLVLLGCSVQLLRMKMVEREEVASKLEQMRKERDRLVGSVPFPSPDNIKLLNQSTAEEKKLVLQGLTRLREVSFLFKEMDPFQFKTELLKAKNNMAEVLNNGGIKFPNLFQFGFDRYDKKSPEMAHTPMLLKQLFVIEELMRICTTNHIVELKTLRRAEFEDSEAYATGDKPRSPSASLPPGVIPDGPAAPALPTHAAFSSKNLLVSTSGKLEVVDQPSFLYVTMPFELKIVCDTDSLRNLLNTLSHSKFIFLTRLLLVENERKSKLSAPAKAGAKPEPGGPGKGVPPLKRGSVPEGVAELARVDEELLPYVLGEERLSVVLLVDWLEFRKEADKAKKARAGQEKLRLRWRTHRQ